MGLPHHPPVTATAWFHLAATNTTCSPQVVLIIGVPQLPVPAVSPGVHKPLLALRYRVSNAHGQHHDPLSAENRRRVSPASSDSAEIHAHWHQHRESETLVSVRSPILQMP